MNAKGSVLCSLPHCSFSFRQLPPWKLVLARGPHQVPAVLLHPQGRGGAGPRTASLSRAPRPVPGEIPKPRQPFLPEPPRGQKAGPGLPASGGSSLRAEGEVGGRLRALRPQASSPRQPHLPAQRCVCGRGLEATSDATHRGHWYLPEAGTQALSWGRRGGEADPGEAFPETPSAQRHCWRRGGKKWRGQRRGSSQVQNLPPQVSPLAPQAELPGMAERAGKKPPTWRDFRKVR